MTSIGVPANALVVLVGAAASGKSTWAKRHFLETEVVSSDRCRALVSDDEADQSATAAAFRVFYEILWQRARLGRLSVADSTSLQPHARQRLLQIASRNRVPAVAVVFAVELEVLRARNAGRARRVPPEVLERHAAGLDRLLAEGRLEREGFAAIHVLAGPLPVARTPACSPLPRAPAE